MKEKEEEEEACGGGERGNSTVTGCWKADGAKKDSSGDVRGGEEKPHDDIVVLSPLLMSNASNERGRLTDA